MRVHQWMSRKHFPLRKAVEGDLQANAVYRMERYLVGISLYTHTELPHMEAVLGHACKKYKVDMPKLVVVSDKERFFGKSSETKITLNAAFHGDNLFTMLHELAHYIVWDDDKEDHGSEWVWTYLQLLGQYKILPVTYGVMICDDFGVDYGQ